MSFYLALISPTDAPLYEAAFTSTKHVPSSAPGSSVSGSSLMPSTSGHGSGSGAGGGGGSGSSFPAWSSFTGVNGTDLGERSRVGTTGGGGGGNGGVGGGMGGVGGVGAGVGADRALMQMIAFKSLDGVEEVMESTGALYLRNVDKWNEWTVSAYLANGVRFILLHDHRNDDGIRLFFLEVWELWVKTLMNPFQSVTTPIRSVAFDNKVRTAARRIL